MPLLLPRKENAQFEAINENLGFHQLKPEDFEVLYNEEEIGSSGLPDLFAHPFIFSKKLVKSDLKDAHPEIWRFSAFEIFRILIRGVFFGVIDVERISSDKLGIYGKLARAFQQKDQKLDYVALLKWRNTPVGGIYPECLVFPGVRLTEEHLQKIHEETRRIEMRFDPDIAGGLFDQWFKGITTNFKLSGEAFSKEEFPSILLSSLKNLYREEYTSKGGFLSALKKELGETQAEQYKNQILNRLKKTTTPNAHVDTLWANKLKIIADEWGATELSKDYADELLNVAEIDVLNKDGILSKITLQRLKDYELAYPFIFSRRLERGENPEFERFSILIRGLFLGVIELTGKNQDVLQWNNQSVGNIYPECLVFPALNVTQDDFDALEKENQRKTDQYGTELTQGLFAQWVSEINAPFQEREDKNDWPLWAKKLQDIVRAWRVTPLGKDVADKLIVIRDVELIDGDQKRSITLHRIQHYEAVQSFLFSRKLENADPVAKENFALLVKGLFFNLISVKKELDREVLMYKDSPVGGIDLDCLVFPYGDGNLTKSRIKALEEAIDKKVKFFGLKTVQGFFAQWVQEVTKELPQEEFELWPLWAKTLRFDVWGDISKVEVKGLRNDILVEGVTVKLRGRDKTSRIRVTLKHCRDYESFFCKRIIRFANGKMTDIPVKSEYLDNIEIKETIKLQSEKDKNKGIYKVKFRDLDNPVRYEIEEKDIINGDKASILLWPDFKAPKWNINYALFHVNREFDAEKKPFIKLISQNGETSRELYDFERLEVQSPVEYVEFFIHDEQTDTPESLGIFKDTRSKIISDVKNTIDLAIDFGTSNSSFAFINKSKSVSGKKEPETLLLKDKTFDLLDFGLDKTHIRNQVIWFPTYHDIPKDASPEGLPSIPSELIFEKASQRAILNLNYPISLYSIPHPEYNRQEENIYMSVLSDFKWEDPFNDLDNRTTASYLRLMLYMVLAILRDKDYYAQEIELRVTFPLAFGKDKFADYSNIFLSGGLLEKIIKRDTGIEVTLPDDTKNIGKKIFIPESDAGISSTDAAGGYQLIVDIGGGTTDIALRKAGDNIAFDSFRYGGNTYAEFLSESNFWPRQLSNVKIPKRDKIMLLNQEIRRKNSFRRVIATYYQKDSNQERLVCRGIDNYYKGLFEYLFILLSAHMKNDKQEVTLYPLGNGWGFSDAVTNNLKDYIEKWFDAKGIQVRVDEGTATRKGAVSVGALRIDTKTYTLPDLEKMQAQSIVGCNATAICGDKQIDIDSQQSIPFSLKGMEDKWNKPSISTEQFFEIFVKTTNWRHVSEVSQRTIVDEFNMLCKQEALDYNDYEKWYIKRSLFTVFLEEIFPKYYLFSS